MCSEYEGIDCIRARDTAKDAINVSRNAYPNWQATGEQDNKVDAVRHCSWTAYMVERANKAFAEKMADAHERAYLNTPLASAMDLYNNKTGFAVGLRYEGQYGDIGPQCVTYGSQARQVSDVSQVGSNVNENDLVFIN